MSVLHSDTTPLIGQTGWEAAHTVENGTVTAAMLDASYQPLDSDLTAIAALSTTAYGRSLLALADAAAGRTALSLGTLATQSGTFSGTSSGTNTGDQTDATLTTSDITTNNAVSTKHGFAPKSPADATTFLNGAATPAYAAVKDADLATTDVTTNNVSTSKHGFTPKAPNDATKFLDGTGAYSTPASGGVTVQYPALKPGTPTDDFAGASLGGGYTAHSSGGTFVTGNCMTQGVDWVGSSVELQYSAQFGGIYTAHADTDLDFTWGGVIAHTEFATSGTLMFGIAALNSVGTGVGVVAYSDAAGYLATITTWNYGSFSDTWAGGGGGNTAQSPPIWFRLKRVSGTWTGYMSKSGRAWDKVFNTRSDSITVDRLYFGLLYSSGSVYSGRLTADYYQLDA